MGESYAYLTKRIDRISAEGGIQMLAMEDFCQLDSRLTQDKYRGSYERCGKIIRTYSSRADLDMTELYMRLLFSYLIGNSDMHLKNFSLIETAYRSNEYVLSPAYDLLPVNVILPEDKEVFALAMNGKKTNIRQKDFLSYADRCGIAKKSAEKMLRKLLSMQAKWRAMCNESLLPEALKCRWVSLIDERSESLSN